MKNIAELTDVAELLQKELKYRFVKYTAPATEGHDPIMLAATALDPKYKILLNPVQLESAKKVIIDKVSVCCALYSWM